jgi:hypothetical protein
MRSNKYLPRYREDIYDTQQKKAADRKQQQIKPTAEEHRQL